MTAVKSAEATVIVLVALIKNKESVVELARSIRKPPEGVVLGLVDVCLLVVETLCCQTDGQMSWL